MNNTNQPMKLLIFEQQFMQTVNSWIDHLLDTDYEIKDEALVNYKRLVREFVWSELKIAWMNKSKMLKST